jgi:hypothetical protein
MWDSSESSLKLNRLERRSLKLNLVSVAFCRGVITLDSSLGGNATVEKVAPRRLQTRKEVKSMPARSQERVESKVRSKRIPTHSASERGSFTQRAACLTPSVPVRKSSVSRAVSSKTHVAGREALLQYGQLLLKPSPYLPLPVGSNACIVCLAKFSRNAEPLRV